MYDHFGYLQTRTKKARQEEPDPGISGHENSATFVHHPQIPNHLLHSVSVKCYILLAPAFDLGSKPSLPCHGTEHSVVILFYFILLLMLTQYQAQELLKAEGYKCVI